jgi:prepilin-type N-terminal cleavage/methylation domain-containing protein
MRERESGFTLLELLLVVGLLGALLAAAGGVLFQAKRTNELSESYAGDVIGLQRALASLESDVRESTRIETMKFGAVHLETPGGAVDYKVHDWVLRRIAGDQVTVLARGILECVVAPEGDLWRVTVRLARPRKSGKRKPEMSALVAPRAAEGAR